MQRMFVFLSLILSLGAQAEMPGLVECTNPDGNGKVVFHSFEFRLRPEEVYPPRYDVRVFIELLEPSSADLDTPVSSEDPLPPQNVIMDQTFSGHRDASDSDLIYFDASGFIRIDKINDDFAMIFQLPSESRDIAQTVENCRLPEPRIGVGN